MSSKRPSESAGSAPEAKKPRHGFRVGPENLPDGPWRRKVTKIKKDLIHKAKVKKAYAKIKAREGQQAAGDKTKTEDKASDAADEKEGEEAEEAGEVMHPTRQLMLADEDKAQINAKPAADDEQDHGRDGRHRRTRRPGYYDKQLEKAEQSKAEAEARREEMKRRQEDREHKIAQRERFKKAMAKTRDRNGNKKLGRESGILLEKVKRMVGEH